MVIPAATPVWHAAGGIASITGLVAPPFFGVTGNIVGVGPPHAPSALSTGSLGVATLSVVWVNPHDGSSDQL